MCNFYLLIYRFCLYSVLYFLCRKIIKKKIYCIPLSKLFPILYEICNTFIYLFIFKKFRLHWTVSQIFNQVYFYFTFETYSCIFYFYFFSLANLEYKFSGNLKGMGEKAPLKMILVYSFQGLFVVLFHNESISNFLLPTENNVSPQIQHIPSHSRSEINNIIRERERKWSIKVQVLGSFCIYFLCVLIYCIF